MEEFSVQNHYQTMFKLNHKPEVNLPTNWMRLFDFSPSTSLLILEVG